MPSVYVRFDTKALENNLAKIIDSKKKRAEDEDSRNIAAGIYAKYIAKYVPYKTGRLRGSARVVNGEVRYSAKAKRPGGSFDYAETQYSTPFPQENRTTPGTYDHWNRHLTTAERQAFYEEVAEAIIARAMARKMNNG